MKTPSRRTIAGVVTVGALLAGAGCSTMSTTQVLKPAQLSDGVSAQVGRVEAHALVLVGAKGQPGVLTGALTNSGTQPVTVMVSAGGSTNPTPIQVPAGSVVELGSATGDASVVVPSLEAEAGAMAPVSLSTPASGEVLVRVPVHSTNSLPYYSTVTPPATSATTGAPTPGTTSSPSGTDTPEATTSPS